MAERRPGIFIPTLYFAEGLPYTIVNMMSVVFFKTLGASNQFIGLTSFLYLPWVAKFLWAPLVDMVGTRRRWVVMAQVLLAVLSLVLALSCLTTHAVVLALMVFALMALASATHDIAIDGFYMDALKPIQQAFYVGIRNAAYKVAWLLGAGGLVWLAGVTGQVVNVNSGWGVAFAVCALLFALSALFHSWYLPHPVQPLADQASEAGIRQFLKIFATYFNQPGIVATVIYILIFRLGDALMLKMAQPFLLDSAGRGGLSVSTAEVGIIYGTVGTIFLLLGGILGGWLVSKGGLRRWLMPTALVQNSAILLYWWLAAARPGVSWVYLVNSIEQFAYGLGVAAYTVFLLTTVKDEYRAAHYAMATALMALGVMLPGAASGFLADWLGYRDFFLLSFLASLPGLAIIFFLQIKENWVCPETESRQEGTLADRAS